MEKQKDVTTEFSLVKTSRLASRLFEKKDWHKLSALEKELVQELENNGFIIPNEPFNGFVGKAGFPQKKD